MTEPRVASGNAAQGPVVIATDLTSDSEPALVRGRAHADAIGAPWIVVHVVPDVQRHHPLLPSPAENDAQLVMALIRKAAELVTEQVGRVLGAGVDEYRVQVAQGEPADEIVRVAEEEHASLVSVGAKLREGAELVLGQVAERVVRYAHATVLVARPGHTTRKVLVATDFAETSQPAVAFGALLASRVGADVTLLHVMEIPRASVLAPVLSALGSPWTPPAAATVTQLESLGTAMLDNLVKEHGFGRAEQIEGGVAADVIAARAEALDVEMVVIGSHSRRGLKRLVLGSTAEAVVRRSRRSVLVVRS
ncbi:MAG: Universal stress protein family [Labilithrix sp.]|nr:Universal stress protein family [Labilithrix sp.]